MLKRFGYIVPAVVIAVGGISADARVTIPHGISSCDVIADPPSLVHAFRGTEIFARSAISCPANHTLIVTSRLQDMVSGSWTTVAKKKRGPTFTSHLQATATRFCAVHHVRHHSYRTKATGSVDGTRVTPVTSSTVLCRT